MTVEEEAAVRDLAGRLPRSFTLGVAAAAFQIEGALSADGRGPSGWDAFAEKPGAIIDGRSPAVACDHYNRSAEDVALMRELGVDSYRFSISWPRIQPEGRGAFNERGLDFYDRLIDQLLEAGISPMATLVPLGYAPAPGASRRLDEQGHRGTLRRILRRGRPAFW